MKFNPNRPFTQNYLHSLYENDTFHVILSTGYAKLKTYSNNATNVYFYNEGDDVILNIDYHGIVEDDNITLPTEFEGFKITVLDKNDSLEVNSEFVISNSINISSTDITGFVTMKLSPELIPPENLLISITGADIVLNWDVNENVDSYSIYSSQDPYAEFPLGWNFEVSVTQNNWTDISAVGIKKFYIVVGVK